MTTQIKLIVGLNNPGAEYAQTRHNVGGWFVNQLAEQQRQTLRPETKFFGLRGEARFDDTATYLLLPTTFMNRSGDSVKALANFFRIAPEAILVVHDDLDLPVGTVRFKQGGGDGGHNGLRSISSQLNTNDYWRLRIGIGHPGQRDRVHDYVLSKPSQSDREAIMTALENTLQILPDFVLGKQQQAIQQLHSK